MIRLIRYYIDSLFQKMLRLLKKDGNSKIKTKKSFEISYKDNANSDLLRSYSRQLLHQLNRAFRPEDKVTVDIEVHQIITRKPIWSCTHPY